MIELLKLMRNEIKMPSIPDAASQLNYKELFLLFLRHRKLKLMRYLFV